MIGGWRIDGHAIISRDGRIADGEGRMPPALRNPADWRRFQAALDASDVVVLGRRSHELTPNPKGRRRLVLSSRIAGLDRQADALWWNPATVPTGKALAAIAPQGLAAVVGGQPVFDWFLATGYDEFHLARADRVALAGGTLLFPGMKDGTPAEDLLAAAGLVAGPREALDPPNGVSLKVWRRA